MADLAGLASLAFVAGALSITSPCCLPLIPGYVSYMGGVAALEEGNRRRVMGAALLFVTGFAVVFTLLGATASAFGEFVLSRLPFFIKISGVFLLVMGLAMLGVLRIPFLYRQARFDLGKIRRGPAGAMPLGMAFAFGWTPCVGPVLGAILTSAAATRTVWKGTTLLFVYSLGMGIPFLLLAFGSSKANRAFGSLRRHARGVERLGGTLLLGMGVLIITGYWQQMFTPLIRWFSQRGWPPI